MISFKIVQRNMEMVEFVVLGIQKYTNENAEFGTIKFIEFKIMNTSSNESGTLFFKDVGSVVAIIKCRFMNNIGIITSDVYFEDDRNQDSMRIEYFQDRSSNRIFAKFDRIKASAPTPKNDILYFQIGSIDNDGVLQADYSKLDPVKDLGYDEFKFSNGKPYQSGTKITDPSFYAIPKEGFSELLTSRALNQSEYNCQVIYDTHIQGFYGSLGYTIKAVSNVDIAP
ncbi:MAG: hypothetical protein EZS28_022867, partial [Streblomastix strix]